jgi:hypothetical protein
MFNLKKIKELEQKVLDLESLVSRLLESNNLLNTYVKKLRLDIYDSYYVKDESFKIIDRIVKLEKEFTETKESQGKN